MTRFDEYHNIYRHIRLERRDGILQLRIHTNDGPAIWGAEPDGLHAELGDAFFRIGRDRENRVVIITGTGDRFITEADFGVAQDMGTTLWDRIFKEGRDLIQNLLEIEVPVIAAANGPAYIHAELLTLSDIVIASERATFADKGHAPNGMVPADGVHVWWEMLLGPNRSRHFLLTGYEISAEEGKQLGFVAEVVPHDRVMERAWEVARELLTKPNLMLRYSRVAMTQNIKRRMLNDLGYGLMLEGMASLSQLGK